MRLQVHGANPVDPGTAPTRPAPTDGVFPDDFYSTTNLDTFVRLDGEWLRVDRPEMDCGLVVEERDGGAVDPQRPGERRAGRRGGGLRRARRPGRDAARRRRAARRRTSGSWPRRCPARSRRRCWCARSPSGCARSKAAGQADPLGRRPGGRAHRRRPGDGPAGPRRLRRRPVRRQRAGHPRHRVVAVRHVARRRPGQGLGRAARARAPHPGASTRSARPARSPRPSSRRADRRRHARDGAGRASRSCWSARCATTARCPTSTPT